MQTEKILENVTCNSAAQMLYLRSDSFQAKAKPRY